MRLPLLLAFAALLAGCAQEPPASAARSVEEYLGGGVAELDDETGGRGFRVRVPDDAMALRMELVYDARASEAPRVFGLPGCEWRMATVLTHADEDMVDCFGIAPGEHEIRVEHDGGRLRMVVRVLARVPGPPDAA